MISAESPETLTDREGRGGKQRAVEKRGERFTLADGQLFLLSSEWRWTAEWENGSCSGRGLQVANALDLPLCYETQKRNSTDL